MPHEGAKDAYLGEHSPSRLEQVADADVPFPDWILIVTRLCSICGSDYKQVFIDFEGVDSPMATLASFPHVMGTRSSGAYTRSGRRSPGSDPGRASS